MNQSELTRWLAGHRPAPAKVCAVLAGGVEHAIGIRNGAHRWTHAAKLLIELRAESIRLYDDGNRVIGQCELTEPDDDAAEATTTAAPAMSMPAAPKGAGELAAVAHAMAAAFSHVVRDVANAQAQAHGVAFKQLAEVAKIANESAREANEAAREAKASLEAYIARRQAELDEREADVEQASSNAQTMAVMGPILQAAAPEIGKMLAAAAGGGKAGSTNGAPQS